MTSNEFQIFIESKQDAFIESMEGVNKELYKQIIGIILDNTHDGKFQMSDHELAILEDEIYDALKNTDYQKIANSYLAVFSVIESKIIQQQADINHFKAADIKELFKKSQGQTILKERMIYDLGKEGLKKNFVKQISDMIRNEAIFNKPSKEVVKLFDTQIAKGDLTTRYVRSFAIGGLQEYHGTLNQEIKVKYELTKTKYIGNLVKDSRPFCTKVMKDLNGRLEDSVLKELLEEYCPAGIPSETPITITDFTGKEHNLKKGSGMEKGTVFSNFCAKCGGVKHECRHIAIPVRRF